MDPRLSRVQIMQPRDRTLASARAALWLAALYSVFVLVAVIAGTLAGAPEPWERGLIGDIARARTQAWGRVFVAITHLGDAITVTVGLAALAVGSAVRRVRGWARFFSATLVGAIGIHPIVKVLVERARPEIGAFIDIRGYAWPSGHAAAAAAIATAVIVYFRARATGSTGMWVTIGAATYAGAVGISRVALGVHWPTDVVAGWLIGAAWVLVLARALRREGNS